MSPRQQRIAELVQRRNVLDQQIARMGGGAVPGVFAPPVRTTPIRTWQDVAHANRKMLDHILSTGVRHVRHDLATALQEAV